MTDTLERNNIKLRSVCLTVLRRSVRWYFPWA